MEGPAGSGKTTTAERLVNDLPDGNYITLAHMPQRPRDYGSGAAALSLLKDTLTTLSLLTIPQSPVVVVDRWLLSQAVYGFMRRQPNNRRTLPPQMLDALFEGLATAARLGQELKVRDGAAHHAFTTLELPFHVHFVIQLPSAEFLIEQRGGAGREFPFDHGEELRLYWQAEFLQRHQPRKLGRIVSFHLLHYNAGLNYNKAYKTVLAELLAYLASDPV